MKNIQRKPYHFVMTTADEENVMKTWKVISAATAILAITGLNSLPFSSAAEETNIEQMIEQAKTPADHEALAAYYEKEAQAAKQKYELHKKMEAAYSRFPSLKQKSNILFHCDTLAKDYETMAKQYEMLAQIHREMAKAAAQ
jgi:hypothetical protein